MTQPLSAIKDSVLLVEGCPAGNPGDGHGSPAGLTGQGNGYYAVNNVVQPAILGGSIHRRQAQEGGRESTARFARARLGYCRRW
ncbi:MAG: hypothetical protein WDO74_36670 [Pseudomonadota bacterium]